MDPSKKRAYGSYPGKNGLENEATVLNTDAFDRRRFKQLYELSENMRKEEKKGRENLGSYYTLMQDTWASLYKRAPKISEETHPELMMNRAMMEKIMSDEEFEGFRRTTLMDDFSSAIGTLRYSEKIYEWTEEHKQEQEEIKNLMKELEKLLEQAQQEQQEADNAQQKADQSQRENNKPNARLQSTAQQKQNKAQATKATAEQIKQQLQQQIQSLINGKAGNRLQQSLREAMNETKNAKNDIESLLGGFQAGKGADEMKQLPLKEQLELAEVFRKNKKLKKVAMWAGRFKRTIRKKQKNKKVETIERNGVTLGNEVEKLIPNELMNFANPITKLDFLRRFAEGQTLIYENIGKERVDKGPIVICIDESGSMRNIINQAKGFMLAIGSIAKHQRRDFAVIRFTTETKTKVFPKGKMNSGDVVSMATGFMNGGTSFKAPLNESLKIINSSRFNKADVIFITDGDDTVSSHFIEQFNKKKEEKQFKVLTILLEEGYQGKVKPFSDEIVTATSFEDESVMDKAFTI